MDLCFRLADMFNTRSVTIKFICFMLPALGSVSETNAQIGERFMKGLCQGY